MNFSFYIYGTPDGYNQYPADNNSTLFQDFAQNNTTESQLTVYRKGYLVYYAYLRRLQEESNGYLGFCLTFNSVYCQHPQKLFALFDRAFDDVLMKGELLRFEKGKCSYLVSKFAEKQIEIERIKTFFKYELENNYNRDFATVPASFKIGNGKKTISIKETSSDILAAIAEFDCVYISNNEKSLSELERTHKMLSELYAEKQNLDTKYRKLAAQKKQYKTVILLCLVVIACVIAFNENLQSKNYRIQSLENDILKQNDTIDNLYSNIEKLKTDSTQLSRKVENLERENARIDRINSENAKYLPVTYQVISYDNYYYRVSCKQRYEETNCYLTSDSVKVYEIENGYGLTKYGWVDMNNLLEY